VSVYRDRILIAVLIVGVCCFTLLPAAYLVLRAWQWQQGLAILELVSLPLFVVFGTAAWLAYRRNQARRVHGHDDDTPECPDECDPQF
jgi:hypothetical protein